MSDLERFKELIAGLDAKVAEKEAAEAERKAERLRLERWREEVKDEPRNAIEIVLRETNTTEFFQRVGRELLGDRTEVRVGNLEFTPEESGSYLSGSDSNMGSTSYRYLAYWSRRIYLTSEDPQVIVEHTIAATGSEDFPVSARVVSTLDGYCSPYRDRHWLTRVKDKRLGDIFHGEQKFRLIASDERGWSRELERRWMPLPVRPPARFHWKNTRVIDFGELREDFEDNVGELIFEAMAKLKGVEP